MKHIQKRGCPHAYLQWCKSVAGTNMEDYRELTKVEKEPLLEALIEEQGGLCAYTMKRIDPSSAHIEHLKPETLCRTERRGSDLDYTNMVACFPRDGMARKYRYGAQQKDDWWEGEGNEFVSPLHPACEQRFQFRLSGIIEPVGNHPAAVNTIYVLKLDHLSLTEDRKQSIEEFIYGPSRDDPLSEAQATRALANVCALDGKGRFYEFCIAIRDAIQEYLNGLKKRTQRRKYAQSQRKQQGKRR
jgi:uncharacterized protein (TIGR02646 family)